MILDKIKSKVLKFRLILNLGKPLRIVTRITDEKSNLQFVILLQTWFNDELYYDCFNHSWMALYDAMGNG